MVCEYTGLVHPTASLSVSLGMTILVLLVLVALVRAAEHVARSGRRVAVGAVVWLGYTGALAASGLLVGPQAPRPAPLLVLAPMLALAFGLGLTSLGRRLATLPAWVLVLFHAFRLPLELVMHAAAREGTMPPQLTFTGWNFDIVTGALALLVGFGLWRGWLGRGAVLVFSAVGSLLLAVVVGVALASLPRVALFGDAPRLVNTWVFYVPFVWLPAVLVGAALLGHVALWRHWWASRSEAAAVAAPAPPA
jgi:hypothetical protein